ncbi:MAG: hypothetical protein PHT46_00180, partial [Candidatus Marinimicrobia bacterium]|nr:hypothetical protein [Candidatus Neomarinimicrobiota bacterium]
DDNIVLKILFYHSPDIVFAKDKGIHVYSFPFISSRDKYTMNIAQIKQISGDIKKPCPGQGLYIIGFSNAL